MMAGTICVCLSVHQLAHRQTEDRQTEDRPTDRQTYRETDRQTKDKNGQTEKAIVNDFWRLRQKRGVLVNREVVHSKGKKKSKAERFKASLGK